jgi:hypothetical protein
MLFKGNSSRLELLIEKIQANKENHVSEQDIKGTLICYNLRQSDLQSVTEWQSVIECWEKENW